MRTPAPPNAVKNVEARTGPPWCRASERLATRTSTLVIAPWWST